MHICEEEYTMSTESMNCRYTYVHIVFVYVFIHTHIYTYLSLICRMQMIYINIVIISTGVWSKGPDMCVRRAIDLAPIVVDGVLYVVGGDVGKEVVPREQAEKIIGVFTFINL